jgi:hypothetical protein
MDEMLAIAVRAFLATIGPSVADPVTQRAIEKLDETLGRVADGDMTPNAAALYIRDLVTVLS